MNPGPRLTHFPTAGTAGISTTAPKGSITMLQHHDPQALPTITGAPFQGGFYAGQLLVDGKLCYLIAAPKAEGELADVAWLDPRADVPGATSCFDGLANTLALAEAGSAGAKRALALSIAGYDDWYWPSRDELELMYRNLKPTAGNNSCSFRDGDNPSSLPAGYPYTEAVPAQTSATAFQAGGAEAFEASWYWSSTQYSRGNAWLQFFGDGLQSYDFKSWQGLARAVRRFIP